MNTEVELHKLGSEVFRPKEKVDLCFTSPPYFNTEKYSDEDTQSYVKYPEEQKWIDGFLFQTIENCYESLKKNGYLLMNIANTSSGKNIENATLDISKGFGLVHEKTLQLTLSSVMGAGYKYEPIFVFKKI
jgi:DNA modification methylase